MTDIENSIATIEMSVLKMLNDHFEYDSAIYTRTIAARTGLSKAYTRCALISLRDKGLVIYCRGLFDDDGMTAGSGYAITIRGEKYLAAKGAATEIMPGETP